MLRLVPGWLRQGCRPGGLARAGLQGGMGPMEWEWRLWISLGQHGYDLTALAPPPDFDRALHRTE